MNTGTTCIIFPLANGYSEKISVYKNWLGDSKQQRARTFSVNHWEEGNPEPQKVLLALSVSTVVLKHGEGQELRGNLVLCLYSSKPETSWPG